MGFFSSLGSTISSGIKAVGSAISSGISSCVNAISGLGSSLGGALGIVSKALSTVIPPLGTIVKVISVISTAMDIIGKIAGVLKPNDNVEDLGLKAMQAEKQDGVTLEKFNNDFDKYMDYIRSQQINPDFAKNVSVQDKQLAGSLIVEKGISIKYPNLQTACLWPIIALATCKIDQSKIQPWADKFAKWVDIAKQLNIPLASVAKALLGDYANILGDNDKFVKNANEKDGMSVLFKTESELNKGSTPVANSADIGKMQNAIKESINELEKKQE